MCGLVKNGLRTEAVTDIPEAIGMPHLMPATGGTRDTGIMIKTMVINGFTEVGKDQKRERNNLM
jgi:hypothetical protein